MSQAGRHALWTLVVCMCMALTTQGPYEVVVAVCLVVAAFIYKLEIQ